MNARLDRRGGVRGYTLLETAIVLTAFLLVAGGMVYPLSNTWSEQTYRSEAEYLQTVRERIVNYAARNRSISHRLAFDGASIVAATVAVPGGRPHLPCPDLDGDGHEDRIRKTASNGVISISVISAVAGVTTYVAGLNFEPGRCIDDKGLLPYRTLGVRANDQWGNHFTYWVDGNFSNSAIGFDQSTRASQMFKYAITPIPGLSGASSGRIGRHYQYVQHIYYNGSQWINEFDLGATQTHFFGNGVILDDSGLVVAGEELDPMNPPLTYDHRRIGARTSAPVPVNEYHGSLNSLVPSSTPTRPDYRPMADGVAFVIVSHGRNGNGATNYEINSAGNVRFVCNSLGGNAHENVNAQRTAPCTWKPSRATLVTTRPAETYAISCPTGHYGCGESRNGIFHVSNTGFSQSDAQSQALNDDIVTWMGGSELIVRLTEAKVLPLPLPPVALIVER